MKHGSLFSGIGGFDLAADWMGWENKFHCEYNEFGQKVLKYYWPNAESFSDITKTDFTKYANEIDILTGGFPCQPFSLAGKRKGKEDERHLWPEMLRAIREIKPRWVVGENVLGIVNWDAGLVFEEVQSDLEAEGYEIQTFILPAAAVNAPHRRDRVWFVAYSRHNSKRKTGNSTGNERKEFAAIHKEGQSGERKTIFNSGFCNLQGTSTDTESERGSKGNGTQPNGSRWQSSEHFTERSEVWNQHQTTSGTGVSTHPHSNGFNRSDCEHEEQSGERGFDALGNIEQMGRDAANTTSIRQEYSLENGKLERGRFGFADKRNTWDSFPSQSPICSRNDGLPTELDGITFSKWRNESIKAAGNAIVPQVVYQIFKAIQEYEQLILTETAAYKDSMLNFLSDDHY